MLIQHKELKMRFVFRVGILLTLMCLPFAATAHQSRLLTPAEFKEQLVGPIVVIGTPFKADGGIDHDGVREMVRRGLANDARVFALTAGDSFYHELSIDEAKSLTRTLVDA